MCSEGYGSQYISVGLSVTVLTATNFVCKAKVRYRRVLHDILQICNLRILLKLLRSKSYGVICLPPLPSMLPEELPMDRRNSSNSSKFFLRRRVCTLSDSFCRMTDLSQFTVNKLLSFLTPVHHILKKNNTYFHFEL